MNTEMNIVVNVSDEETMVLCHASKIMRDIWGTLCDCERNGQYCFVDHVNLPESVKAILREAELLDITCSGNKEKGIKDIDLDFTREDYENLVTGDYMLDELYGVGYMGAVCYEIIFREYQTIDVNFYLLGKDDGYGERDGIPFSHEDGFEATVYDTYDETLSGIKRDIKKYISSHPDLAKGAKNTVLTWKAAKIFLD